MFGRRREICVNMCTCTVCVCVCVYRVRPWSAGEVDEGLLTDSNSYTDNNRPHTQRPGHQP